VTLLGGFRLAVGGRDVRLPVGAQRLVAVLALRGQVSRSHLAGTLWPDTLEHRALASLRTGIWRVNRAAPGLVAITASQLDLDTRTRVDVRVLVKWSVEVMRGEDFDACTLSTGVPDGELLPGWGDAWLTDERERLHQMRLHLLEKVAERLADTGQFGLAVEVALSVLRADVLRESAHRTLIRIHLAEGNLGQARCAYAACEQLLWRELGVAPSAAMTGLLRGTQGGVPVAGVPVAGVSAEWRPRIEPNAGVPAGSLTTTPTAGTPARSR
ncbi:MAG: AfsR/SARP family transcriptional regulator, partial [Nocardioidaceae bacterium]